MTSDLLYTCVNEFQLLIGTVYTFHIGRKGKHIIFHLAVTAEDFHHLMGLHYLLDRKDPRRRDKILNDLLTSDDYRKYIASSSHWTSELESRVLATTLLSKIIEDNNTVIRYNSSKLDFYSQIAAKYLLINKHNIYNTSLTTDIYLFIDNNMSNPNTMFCKSLFLKQEHDYSINQEKWTLLYKCKTMSDGSTSILYKHKNYVVE